MGRTKTKGSTTTTIKESSPVEGRFIDPPTNKWIIGKELGKGSCGSVHQLSKQPQNATTSRKKEKDWVVKLAKLSKTNARRSKNRKKTLMERNADLLNHEDVLYRSTLNDLRGTMVPDVPMGSKNPSGIGEIDGYRFLVMEQMEAPLSSIIPILFSRYQSSLSKRTSSRRARKTSNTDVVIPLGQIATRLITLLEQIHYLNYVFVDVKAENYMLGFSSSNESDIVKRIRLIDFGQLESYNDVTLKTKNKHRHDEYQGAKEGEGVPIIGTPLYASCNISRGHTVSRRDDLEACGYVICELILQLGEYVSSNSGGVNGTSVVKDGLLPWSRGMSDTEVLKVKEEAMKCFSSKNVDDDKSSLSSEFYDSLAKGRGNRESVADVMRDYFNIVMNLKYKEKPDYDRLKSILGELKASTLPDNEDDDQIAKKPKARSSMRRRSAPVVLKLSSNDDSKEQPIPQMRTTNNSTRLLTKTKTPTTTAVEDATLRQGMQVDPNLINLKRKTRSSLRTALLPNHHDAVGGVHGTPSNVRKMGSSKSRKKRVTQIERITTTVEVIDSDEEENLGEVAQYREVPFPTTVPNFFPPAATQFENAKEDSDIEMMTTVEDLEEESWRSCHSSHSEDGFEENAIPMQIDITFGGVEKENILNRIPQTEAGIVRGNTETVDTVVVETRKAVSSIKNPKYGLKLVSLEGPHKGESICIESAITFGSNPSNRTKSKPFRLENDSLVSASHAKLVLTKSGGNMTKKKKGKTPVLSIRVHDLKSTNGTFVDGQKIPVGGTKQAFVGHEIQIGKSTFEIKKI